MLEIDINKAVKNYGFKNVLDEFNLDIYANEKVALIGSNGSGKTTLLKIISGEENLNSGTISIRKGSRISFLKQTPPKEYDNYTVKEILEKDLKEIFKIEEQLKDIENKMKLNTDKLIKKYSKLMDKYEYLGGYEINAKINKICDSY